jgi:hypothetical protein
LQISSAKYEVGGPFDGKNEEMKEKRGKVKAERGFSENK